MENNLFNTKSLSPRLKSMKKSLKKNGCPCRTAEKELLGLLAMPSLTVLANGKYPVRPFLGEKIAALDKITDQGVKSVIDGLAPDLYLTDDEFEGLVPLSKLVLLEEAVAENNEEKWRQCGEKLAALNDLDGEKLERLNPLHQAFSADPVYAASDEETRRLYRRKTALVAKETGIDQQRLAFELANRAEKGNTHIGELIWHDFAVVFRRPNQHLYIWSLLIGAKLHALVIGLLCGGAAGFLAYIPCIGILKPFADLILAKIIKPDGGVPRFKADTEITPSLRALGVPKKAKTVCVISTLINSEEAVKDGLEKLRQAKIRNPQQGIEFALLCDLPAAKAEKIYDDKRLLDSIRPAMAEKSMENAVVLVRSRSFCKTQNCWQGRERKRGAIEELARFCKGERVRFRQINGDGKRLRGANYLAALDYDTLPLMDTVQELTLAAMHPLNKKYGILAPRISTSLASSLKTEFSRQMGGCGGVGCISAYDSVSGEFYSDCFGEGIFTGKGLIRIKPFLERTRDAFPDQYVLSHDILEGGLLGVKFAGDVEFTDSFPSGSKAYFKRQHRWLRGDFQNLRFLFKKEFSPLTKFKLYDNFRRGIAPITVVALFFASIYAKNGWIAALTALLALILPYLPSLFHAVWNGLGFGLSRQFYSPVFTEAGALCRKCLLEIITLTYSAVISLDALLKTLWRTLFSHKQLLQWTTSGMLEKSAGKSFLHILPAFVLSVVMLACALMGGSLFVTVIAVLTSAALPLLVWLDRERKRDKPVVTAKMREGLTEQAEKMWLFYTDFVTEEDNFLPPDNVQFSPVFRVNRRTSPTNVGMYLLSCAAVRELGIIGDSELFERVEKTISTVEKLKKWNGNLFNWYRTDDLSLLSDFVSTVDSGNFVCCLVTVFEELKKRSAPEGLLNRVKALIDATDLKPFFDRRKKLFSIGWDDKKGELAPNHYDMLMSEARMTSYYAVSSGQVEKAHWRALARTMSRCGRYAGPVAWTGTMFEFFMPELLLTSKEGSLSYEALRYALYCQKRRSKPFGISESGYYAFDRELNYQYKAHGVQKLGLKAGLDRELVISPYSSFLTLASDPVASYNNLVLLEREGAENPAYGFYEAVDYTFRRTGRKAVVKSHMAHHVGMSIAGTANLLADNILGKLFMQNEKTERGSELLEERIMAGEKILRITEQYDEGKPSPNEQEEITDFNPLAPAVNALWGGGMSLFTGADGVSCGYYKGRLLFRKSDDLLLRPQGQFFGLVEKGRLYPFVFHPLLSGHITDKKTVFSANETAFEITAPNLAASMRVNLCCGLPAEILTFEVENPSAADRSLTLCAYLEPVLCGEAEYKAHPAFADLFLRAEHDVEKDLFIASRKARHGDGKLYAAIGFFGEQQLSWCLSREEVLSCNDPFSFFGKAEQNETADSAVPCPCVFLKAKIRLKAREKHTTSMFLCLGDSRTQVIQRAEHLRKQGAAAAVADGCANPLSRSALHGQLAADILPALLYGKITDRRILTARRLSAQDSRCLWRYGISGDKPLIIFEADEPEQLEALLQMKQGLALCGVETDLAAICPDERAKALCLHICAETPNCGEPFFLLADGLTEEDKNALYANASAVFPKGDGASEKEKADLLLPIKPCEKGDNPLEQGFHEDMFVVEGAPRPWCNVVANQHFGTLVSQNSLGFTWAFNSRENKLTPWYNDLCLDNSGELLLIKTGNELFDCVRGSKAVFSPNAADYYGKIKDLEVSVSVRVGRQTNGKELTVTVLNTGKETVKADLAFYVQPLLNADCRRLSLEAEEITLADGRRALAVANSQNFFYKGAMGLSCSKKAAFVTDRSDFFGGNFHSGLKSGEKGQAQCAAAVVPLQLPPRQREKIRFILSCSAEKDRLADVISEAEKDSADFAFENTFKTDIADQNIRELFNYWLPWQTLGCRMWARTGFYQNGGAYGFRDQLQDCLCVTYLEPAEARTHIIRCCRSQFEEGDVLHWWHQLGDLCKGVRTRYSDDLLWLPYVACRYAEVTEDTGLWDVPVKYIQGDLLSENQHELFMEPKESAVEESVYLHCKRAMEKAFATGAHGLLLMGCGDWNDGYNNVGLNGKGESVWLSMFYVMCVRKFAALARSRNDTPYGEKLENRVAKLIAAIEETAWDGEYYLRAFYDDGSPMGGKDCDSCKIDLLPQAFATLCGLPDKERNKTALKSAIARLVDQEKGIIKLFDPPFEKGRGSHDPGYVSSYPAGVRENGGQYTHAAVWLCLACFKAGLKEEGWRLLKMLSPANRPPQFGNEPYAMTADVYTNPNCYGRGGWSLYTGAAGWYWQCILEGLFGVEIKGRRLTASPNLPDGLNGACLEIALGRDKAKITFVKGKKGTDTAVDIAGNKETEIGF